MTAACMDCGATTPGPRYGGGLDRGKIFDTMVRCALCNAEAAAKRAVFDGCAQSVAPAFVAVEIEDPALCAEDVRSSRLDRDAHGRVFPEIKLAAARQVLRSIATEQPTASAVIRALALATLEVIDG